MSHFWGLVPIVSYFKSSVVKVMSRLEDLGVCGFMTLELYNKLLNSLPKYLTKISMLLYFYSYHQ